MKASQIRRGYTAVKRVPLPLAGVGQSLLGGPHPDGAQDAGSTPAPGPVDVGLRPLPPWDEAEIVGRAMAYAKAHGAEDPQEGSELVEFGKSVYRCLLGVVDPDSDPSAPAPFFDEGVEQIEHWTELGKDGVLTLAQMHQEYQDEVTGQIAAWTDEGILGAAKELAGPRGPFVWYSWRPGLQLSFALTTASLLSTLLPSKSSSGSDSEKSTTVSTNPRKPRTKGSRR